MAEALKSLMMMEELETLYGSGLEFGELISIGCRKLIGLLPSMTRIKDETGWTPTPGWRLSSDRTACTLPGSRGGWAARPPGGTARPSRILPENLGAGSGIGCPLRGRGAGHNRGIGQGDQAKPPVTASTVPPVPASSRACSPIRSAICASRARHPSSSMDSRGVFCHDQSGRISEDKERYKCYYPFLDYSPELAAFRAGCFPWRSLPPGSAPGCPWQFSRPHSNSL